MCPLNSMFARSSLTFMWTRIGLLGWCLWNLANCRKYINLANLSKLHKLGHLYKLGHLQELGQLVVHLQQQFHRMHSRRAWQLLNAQSIQKQIGWTYSANSVWEYKTLNIILLWFFECQRMTLPNEHKHTPKWQHKGSTTKTPTPKQRHKGSNTPNTKASKRIYRSFKP
jgi:hypothetical protein